MTMIPCAPAPAPAAAPSSRSAPARASGELDTVFSALVDALTEEFLPADESSSTPEEPPATDVALAEPGPTGTDAAAVVAMLLAGSGPADLAAGSVPAAGVAGAAVPAADQTTPAPTIPADVVPDADVDAEVGGTADGPVETTATLEAAVEAGPVPPQTGGAEDRAEPIGLDTVDAMIEAGAVEPTPSNDGADAPVEVLPTADDGAPVDTSPVTTENEAGDGDTADADRSSLEGAAGRPEPTAADAASTRPGPMTAGSDASTTTSAVTGSAPPTPSAPVDGVSTSGAPTPPTPTALPDQLVTVLEPLRRGPDGTHRVAIQLRPDDLGEVQIDVQVRGNQIALSLRADLPGTVDLLRASIAELRAQLEAAGFQAGDLDVTGHGAADDQRSAAGTETADGVETAHGLPAETDDAATTAPSPLSATGLDLRL